MARFKFLLILPETPPVTLFTAAFKGNKEKSNKYEEI